MVFCNIEICEKVIPLLYAAMKMRSGESLPEEERAFIHDHLLECETCRVLVEEDSDPRNQFISAFSI